MQKQIELEKLKQNMSEKAPDTFLSQMILSEKDYVTIEEFLKRSETWFEILKVEKRKRGFA